MDYEVREATSKDFDEIIQLSNIMKKREHEEFDSTIIPNWSTTKSGQRYLKSRLRSKDSYVLVTYVDGVPVGYLIGSMSRAEDYRTPMPFAELENMYVLRKYRKNGIGSAMINKFIEWCESRNVQRLRAVTSPENKGGIDFYKKFGFLDYYVVLETELK